MCAISSLKSSRSLSHLLMSSCYYDGIRHAKAVQEFYEEEIKFGAALTSTTTTCLIFYVTSSKVVL